jgi:hypothetical protein
MLSGGESACDSMNLNQPDYYGKFAWAWESDGNDSTSRLMDWLDPDSTNIFILDGHFTDTIDSIPSPLQAIFPNPFIDNLIIRLNVTDNRPVHIEVYDIPGRLLFSEDHHLSGNGSVQLNLEFLPRGLYLLRIESQETTITNKIIRR